MIRTVLDNIPFLKRLLPSGIDDLGSNLVVRPVVGAIDTLRGPVGAMIPSSIREYKRNLDPGYDGPIFIWDIDKTYLESDFDSAFSILQHAVERAKDKVNIPGTAILLQRLKHGPGEGNASFPVYFLTASPPQVGHVFEEKLRLDGVECDGVTFKNFVHYIATLRVGYLWEHVGYKVIALLQNRLEFPPRAHEILFGDNSEQDPIVYALYSEICGKRISGPDLVKRLRDLRVLEEDIDTIQMLQNQMPLRDPVEHIYIHMIRSDDPARIEGHHERMIATYNSLQTASHLFTNGYLKAEDVLSVAWSLRRDYGFTQLELARSLLNMWRRELLSTAVMDDLIDLLRRNEHLPRDLRRDGENLVVLQDEVIVQDTYGQMALTEG